MSRRRIVRAEHAQERSSFKRAALKSPLAAFRRTRRVCRLERDGLRPTLRRCHRGFRARCTQSRDRRTLSAMTLMLRPASLNLLMRPRSSSVSEGPRPIQFRNEEQQGEASCLTAFSPPPVDWCWGAATVDLTISHFILKFVCYEGGRKL